MQGNIVYISPLQADSMLNQANLFKRLLEECGYEAIYKSTISVEDLDKDDVAGAIWFQLATINFIGDAIVPYILGKKPKVLYVTIEGVPTRGNIAHSNIKRCEFVAVSKFVKECLQSVGLKVRKVVHHAIDWKLCGEIHKRNLLQKRQTEQLAKDRVKFIVVARDDPRKNLKGLADAMRILNQKGYEKDYVVFLITNDSAKEKFQGINNAVFLKGFGGSPHETILGYMACCDYLIHPAYSEGFGLPVLEANAVGIPAVHCFPPNTLVATADGFKPIENIKIGDLVLTHKGRFRKVTKVFKRYYKGKLIGIKPHLINKTIWFTEEHPILTSIKSKNPNAKKPLWLSSPDKWLRLCGQNTMSWTPAKDITKNHVVVVPRIKDSSITIDCSRYVDDVIEIDGWLYPTGRNQTGKEFALTNRHGIPRIINPDDSWLKVFGYYISEGCMCKGDVQFCLGTKDLDIIEDLFSVYPYARIYPSGKKGINVFIANRPLRDLLIGLFDYGARNKQIPLYLLQLPSDKLRKLLYSMVRGDGQLFLQKGKVPTITYTTASVKLALSVFMLTAKLGNPACISFNWSGRRGHQLHWSYIGDANSQGKPCKIDDDFVYLPIRNIETKEYEGYVYNLEVEEDNSYVVEGIAVHNCDYPPLNEFSSPDFNFVFNYVDKQPVKANQYQYWIFHVFTPDMLAEVIGYAIDIFKNHRDEYEEYCIKAREWTRKWDYHVKYAELMKELRLPLPQWLVERSKVEDYEIVELSEGKG